MTDEVKPAENPLVSTIKQDLGAKVVDVTSLRPRRFVLTATPETYRDVIKYAQEKLDCYHLSLINGIDTRTNFEVVYHFWSDRKGMFSVRVVLPHDKPSIRSVVDIVPAAILYEREVHDLFGIEFPGHPDMRRLLLNEDWPEGEHPLRKDWKMDEKKFYGGVKGATGGEKVA